MSWLRGVPRMVWAITALHVGLMLCFSLLFPAFTGFDETQHVDAVMSIRHGHGWPDPTQRKLSEGIVQVATPVLNAENKLPFSRTPIANRGDRPSIVAAGDAASTSYTLPNQMTQHPPLYYAVGAAVLAVTPGSTDWPYDRTVAVLRLLSILMMAPLPLIAWATAGALRASPLVGLTAAALPLTLPQLQRVGSSVNNDALYTLCSAAAIFCLVRVVMGDLSRRMVVSSGVLIGLALLTKGFALVLPLAALVAFAMSRTRVRRVPEGFLCLAVAFVVGGWWWLRNIVQFGTVQPSGVPASSQTLLLGNHRAPGTAAPLSGFVEGAYRRLSARFWGGLGINYEGPDTFPQWLINLLVLVVIAAIAVAVLRLRPPRAALLGAVLLPFLATLAIVIVGIYSGYTYSLHFPGAQGRYLFASVPSMSAAVALGLAVVAGRARRWLPAAVVLLALGLQGYALNGLVRRDWMPTGVSRSARFQGGFDAIVHWSPWPSAVSLLFAAATLAAAVLLAVLTVRLVPVSTQEPVLIPSEPVSPELETAE